MCCEADAEPIVAGYRAMSDSELGKDTRPAALHGQHRPAVRDHHPLDVPGGASKSNSRSGPCRCGDPVRYADGPAWAAATAGTPVPAWRCILCWRWRLRYLEGRCPAAGGCSVAVITLASGVVPTRLHSRILNEILAFDMAEFLGHLRQVNAIVVSSFAGPECTIWGYDGPARGTGLAGRRAEGQRHDGELIPVKPLRPLVEAGDALLEAYPLLAGTVTPCALRTITAPGPCVVSAAMEWASPSTATATQTSSWKTPGFSDGAGVRQRSAARGRGRRAPRMGRGDRREHRGRRQPAGLLYEEIFAGVTSAEVPAGHFGGGRGVPYCLLPRAAVPDDPAGLLDPVETWSQARWRAQFAASRPADMNAGVWGGVSVALDLTSFIPFIWAALTGPAQAEQDLLVHVVSRLLRSWHVRGHLRQRPGQRLASPGGEAAGSTTLAAIGWLQYRARRNPPSHATIAALLAVGRAAPILYAYPGAGALAPRSQHGPQAERPSGQASRPVKTGSGHHALSACRSPGRAITASR